VQRRHILFDIQHQSFKVFAFGVIDIDGVVGGLGELVEYADAAVRLGCGA